MKRVTPDTDLISLSDAAFLMGCSWAVAWRRLLRGDLEGQRIGRQWLASRRSAERLARQAEKDRTLAGSAA
jgi:hypothetical protein